jgi:hypothetical protein
MVPSYSGTSSYLIFTKYNNYAGFDGGDGVNRIAILDPNATMVDPHGSSDGLSVMQVVMSIAGPTPDFNNRPFFPNAVREWCINTAAVDPFTDSILANSEDGKLYRWDLRTNSFSESMTLTSGLGEAYTPTAIGTDGTVYAVNDAKLFAVGKFLSNVKEFASQTNPVFGQTVTLNAFVFGHAPSAPTGTVQFFDGSTALGSATIDSTGRASIAISTLNVGAHSITAQYGGDGNYITAASAVFTVTVGMDGSHAGLKSSNPSAGLGAPVTFTASVTGSTTGLAVTSGTVTFFDGTAPIGSAALDSTGHAQLITSSLSRGTHSITASFGGNGNYMASVSAPITQSIGVTPVRSELARAVVVTLPPVGGSSTANRSTDARTRVSVPAVPVSATEAQTTSPAPLLTQHASIKLRRPAAALTPGTDIVDRVFSEV